VGSGVDERTAASRRRGAIGVLLGTAGLLVSGAVARRGLPAAERDVFRAANDVPIEAYPVIWAPMQFGTFGTAPALAAVAALRGRRRLAISLVAAGTLAWVGAKAVKRVVRRERPARIIRDVRIRGEDEGDRGFPSGHAAVSAALSTVAMPALSPAGRAGVAGLAASVAYARVYIGVHLPLDVVGGAALGVAVGSAVRLVIGDAPRGAGR
jgi:glycosyltransferase 2 family protein